LKYVEGEQMGKCKCLIRGKFEEVPLYKINTKTVIILYKGKYIKRHIEKHLVEFLK